MPAAIITLTLGGILILSALKGISVIDVIGGSKAGDTLDPHGGSMATEGNTAVTPGTATSSTIPFVNTGNWTAPAGGAAGFKGPNAALLNHLASVAQNQFHLVITATTNGSHVPGSYHYQGRAFDASGDENNMRAFAGYVFNNAIAQIKELIHNPGPCILDGKPVNGAVVYAAVWAGHKNHVHTAA